MRKWFYIFCILLVACSAKSYNAHTQTIAAERGLASVSSEEYGVEKLKSAGLSQEFISSVVENYRSDEKTKVIELNILGFLKIRPTHNTSLKIPTYELVKVQKFLRKYRTQFSRAEKRFHVPKEIIASLLWVETKYGRDVGTFHVPSVFFSLLQADHPDQIQETLSSAQVIVKDYSEETEQKVKERSKKRSDWALEQLQALNEIHTRGWKDLNTLVGSFSGAFGMPQFIPSSYISWAKSAHGKKVANLYLASDSIFSVGNYLKTNGWGKKRSQQKSALLHYNRDPYYAGRILKMGSCVKKLPTDAKKLKKFRC
ncbi:MAG: lytic murein transglycosylase [Oligoflexia bacterium]|nr:lytic murein transglycosylase [Oligoflexia bacterium]